MYSRTVFAGFLIAAVSFTLSGRVAAQGTWTVEKTFRVGGDGGWDYVTLDAKNHRLYVPRSTHTMGDRCRFGKDGRRHSRPEAGLPLLVACGPCVIPEPRRHAGICDAIDEVVKALH